MQHNSILSILHISDFHFTRRRQRDQDVVVDALVEDLKLLCIGHRRPDVIMFTGDLVQAGGVDSHHEAYDKLLSRVSAATACSDERIFIVPGNHDVSRAFVKNSSDTHRYWRTESNDSLLLNDLYASGKFDELLNSKFGAYKDLESYLSSASRIYKNAFVSIHRLDEPNIKIVIINTSSFSTGGLDTFGIDSGKLAVPEHSLLDGLKVLKTNSYRIFCTHHPLGQLAETSEKHLVSTIQREAHLHLFGHRHEPLSANITALQGTLYSDQAGAIFTSRTKAYIGYSLISVDRSKELYETHLRTYFDERKAFDEARDLVEGGRFYSSQQSREFWRTIARPIDEDTFKSFLSGKYLIALEEEMQKNGQDNETHTRFVPPPLTKHIIQRSENSDNIFIDTPVTFDELLSATSNAIIYASPEYGRTTILKEMRMGIAANAQTSNFPRMPAFLEFESIKQNPENMLNQIKSRSVLVPDDADIESMLKLGKICLLVDDVDFFDVKRMSIFREFVNLFPKIRYVISSTKTIAAPYGTHVVPEMPVNFDFIEIGEFRRSDMRKLVTKFNNCGNVDVLLDRLQSEFQEINLPFTAANGSILMTIYEEQSGFQPINRSVLIEQFIDTTLRKAAIEQSRRETFDYANKTAMLAHVAGWMAQTNNYVPGFEDLRDTMRSYLDGLGLNPPLDDIMREFQTARILVPRSDHKISFRYRAVLEYFIALKMSHDALFKSWVLDETRYLQFPNEIQYYSGKTRNDAELVSTVSARFAEQIAKVYSDLGTEIDLHQLSKVILPSDDESSIEHLSDQLSLPPMSQEDRDKELQAELPSDVEARQEVFRPSVELPGQRLIVGLLLYSGVVKNMELIPDAEKRVHLENLFKGWSIFMQLSLSVVPELARHRRVRINGVLYEINAPISMSDNQLMRAIALRMPIGISRLASTTLGTEKLERQLVEPTLDSSTHPLVYEFIRTALVADLRLPATANAISVALDRFKSSRYLKEAMIWKIADLRRHDRINSEHNIAVTSAAAKAIAELKGGSKTEKDKEVSRQIRRINKEALVLKIKNQIGRET